MGLVIDSRPSHLHGRGMIEQVFLDRVSEQAHGGGQPAGDRGAGPTGGFEVAGEQLEVSAADREQAHLPLAAPRR
jgi:hypothetical protein